MQRLREEVNQEVTVKKGKEKFVIKDAKLAEAVLRAYNIWLDMKSFEPAMQEYKNYIAKIAKDYIDTSGTLTFSVDNVSCRVTFGYECVIPEENIDEVKRILGDRFEDLVRIKIKYEGTSKLIDMAADADRGQKLAECLVIREKAPTIRFEAETPR